jgi:histo-blood group ABO system transferase
MAFGAPLYAARIALNVVATGKYAAYADEMLVSARRYFCTDHEVHFFVFTDGEITAAPDVTQVFQKRLGWPYDTLMRFAIYLKNKELFKEFDYVFATDADMLFVSPVGSEILSERVATQHPGYTAHRGTYETNKISKAYVAPHEGKYYFCGGFYGGSKDEFFNMMEAVVAQIETDLQKNFIAVWHDESHLNRFFIDNLPTKILSPSYCYPENAQNYRAIWHLKRKLVALDKNHNEVRK